MPAGGRDQRDRKRKRRNRNRVSVRTEVPRVLRRTRLAGAARIRNRAPPTIRSPKSRKAALAVRERQKRPADPKEVPPSGAAIIRSPIRPAKRPRTKRRQGKRRPAKRRRVKRRPAKRPPIKKKTSLTIKLKDAGRPFRRPIRAFFLIRNSARWKSLLRVSTSGKRPSTSTGSAKTRGRSAAN